MKRDVDRLAAVGFENVDILFVAEVRAGERDPPAVGRPVHVKDVRIGEPLTLAPAVGIHEPEDVGTAQERDGLAVGRDVRTVIVLIRLRQPGDGTLERLAEKRLPVLGRADGEEIVVPVPVG